MRVFITGATGFLGGRLAAMLRARGDEVVALARSTSRVRALDELGARVVEGDVTDRSSLKEGLVGADVAIHVAAWYELGVRDAARMQSINVEGTRNVLCAAIEAKCRKIVHCSSVAALGSTGGKIVDEEHVRQSPYGSSYERTKSEAHELAKSMAKDGAPISIASPGTIFGPGDRSMVAHVFRAHLAGVIVAAPMLDLLWSLVFVEDCARGLIAVADRGAVGRAYNLVGEVTAMGEWLSRMAEITGKPAPKVSIPSWAVRAAATSVGWVAPLVREAWAMADGASWGFSSKRAREELGWTTTEFDLALAKTAIAFDARRGERFRPTTDRGRRALDAARRGSAS